MLWYTAHYGTWRSGDTVTRIDFGNYCYGTHNRKEAFTKAQETANKTGRTVTVMWHTPSVCGLKTNIKKVAPESGQSKEDQDGNKHD